jgi:spore coat protein U-like protein
MKPKSIRLKPFLWLAALAMLAFASCAQARINCTASAPAVNTAYPLTGGALNITASSIVVTCTATSTTARTASYQLKATPVAPAGCAAGQAKSGANCLTYYLSTNAGCTTPWTGTTYIPVALYTTPTLTSSPGPVSDVHTFYFYGCIAAGLAVPAAGVYTGTTTIAGVNFVNTPVSGAATFTGSTVTVNITAPATCTLSTPPGNINFTYSSFGAAANASTTFAATCTNFLPYTMALDATSGTLLGLNYTLALSAASATGNGLAQSYTINGTIAAGQGGTCAATTCTGTQARVLTITY